ncbi:hypothetical protein RND71_001120 [Anisodus tanguticus]|uniref:Uncharacterized protein n=1 Tax=Anisodus tanguticus TaxID=243964 RepID=A0AAE1SX96_9SOLA|nr:hypothetical protein RND71_001120 [Anisodus tanguticus]
MPLEMCVLTLENTCGWDTLSVIRHQEVLRWKIAVKIHGVVSFDRYHNQKVSISIPHISYMKEEMENKGKHSPSSSKAERERRVTIESDEDIVAGLEENGTSNLHFLPVSFIF